jgi:hypothetical protein
LPARAQVRFLQKGDALTASTDVNGSYEATLWQPRRYIVETVIAERPMPPFTQDVAITSSQTLHIRVPANSLRVRVYDADDGKPIQPAQITVHNRWSDERGASSSVSSVAARGEITELPPQRPGTAAISVHAAGYKDGGPVTVPIDDATRDRLIEIAMTREADVAGLQILLDDGTPAAGAEMARFSGEEMTWHATADESGRIIVPKRVDHPRLLVRHPSAASVAGFGFTDSRSMRLDPAAPPLVVKVVHRDGTPIGPSPARIMLLVGHMTGAEAGFMTWSLGGTAPDGTFVARGLPRKAFQMLATRSASAAQIHSGSFDALATTIPYPWPAVVVVPLADE